MRFRGARRNSSANWTTGVIALFVSAFIWLTWWELSYQNYFTTTSRWVSSTQVRATTEKPGIHLNAQNAATIQPTVQPQNMVQTLEVMTHEAVAEGEVEAASVPYRVVQLSRATEAANVYCTTHAYECAKYNEFEKAVLRQATENGDEQLHLVPVDPLSMIREAEPALYEELLENLVETVDTDRYYIRYKGSDYVFICFMSDCQRFGEELGEKLAAGKGTRAIFVGTDLKRDQLNWPCPLRVIDIDSGALLDMAPLSEKILKAAGYMTEKINRWVCADADHPAHYFGEHNESMSHGGIYMKKYGFMMCAIPKSGSTMMKFLLRRMMHRSDWRSREHGLPHNPKLAGILYLNRLNSTTIKRVYDDLSILKAAVVRHPIPRFLSAYLDKIKILKEYQRIKGLVGFVEAHGAPSFSDFMDYLFHQYPNPDDLDEHFRIQSSFCGMRDCRFDFVGTLSELGTDFKEFSQSLGFFDKYVASGWGEDQNQQFGVRAYQPDQRWSGLTLWEYYTEELMMKVYDYYKEDFDRFGFSIDEALASRPTTSPAS